MIYFRKIFTQIFSLVPLFVRFERSRKVAPRRPSSLVNQRILKQKKNFLRIKIKKGRGKFLNFSRKIGVYITSAININWKSIKQVRAWKRQYTKSHLIKRSQEEKSTKNRFSTILSIKRKNYISDRKKLGKSAKKSQISIEATSLVISSVCLGAIYSEFCWKRKEKKSARSWSCNLIPSQNLFLSQHIYILFCIYFWII